MDDFGTTRFRTEQGNRILVQVPGTEAERVLAAILAADTLTWGDYDQVSFTTAPGTQRFRSLPGGVNAPTEGTVGVECVELQVFTAATGADLERILLAVYAVHPYEEPVIQLVPATRTLHIPGTDEDNPNRFWNRPDQDWIPQEHRRKQGRSDQRA